MTRSVPLAPFGQKQTTQGKEENHHLFHSKDGTNPSCCNPHHAENFYETEEEFNHFIPIMKCKIAGHDPCDIINMDQSTIPYSYHSSKTLEMKGTKTINVCALTAYGSLRVCKNLFG